MGNSQSVKTYVENEFSRVQEKPISEMQNYVNLTQLLEIKPLRDWTLDFGHLGTLWVLDSERRGVFHVEDFVSFAAAAHKRAKANSTASHEFQSQVQAYCTMQLYNAVTRPAGMTEFVKWFTKLLTSCTEVMTFKDHPNELYVGHDPLMVLFKIFQLRDMYGMYYQDFFDLLQRVGEEKELLHLDAEHLDDVVPVAVLTEFAETIMEGFVSMMNDMDFETGMKVD